MTNTETDQYLSSPGQQLLEARERNDISAEMIAQRLRLDVGQIHALEKDEYTSFPAIAYVRGYLLGYAKIVGLDSEQLLTIFDQNSKTAPSLEPHVSRPEQQAASGDKHIRVVTWSLIAALALLLILWWQTQRSSEEVPADQESDNQQAEMQIEDNPQLEMIKGSSGTLSLSETTAESAEPVQEEPKELVHDYDVVQMSELPEPPEQNYQTEMPESTPTLSDQTSDQTTDQNSVDIQNFDEAQKEDPAQLSAEDPVQKSNGIVLQFTDDSWIQITDATGEKQFSRTGKAGEVVDVTGTAPFRIVIGRASVVILSYQGNFIELDQLATDEVARFRLDENGAHRY